MKRILVVDDDEVYRKITKRFLEEKGYEVIVESDGETGYERVLSDRPDLILMDVVMPKQNGLVTVDRLRSNDDTKEIPVIINSSYNSAVDIAHGENVAGVYNKSTENNQQLLALIEEILKNSG